MVARDLSSLPRATDLGGGVPPAPRFVVTDRLLNAWFADAAERDVLDRPKANELLAYRASFAGTGCDRALHYKLVDAPKSNPMTIVDYWRTGLGTAVHDTLQAFAPAIAIKDNARVEVEVEYSMEHIGIPGTGHVDFVVYIDDKPHTVVELKSVNGFGFKKMATNQSGPPSGPRFSAILQGAFAVVALDAHQLVVSNVSLEAISPAMVKNIDADDDYTRLLRRIAAEWVFDRATCDRIVADETARIRNVMAQSTAGALPIRQLSDPEYPQGAVVVSPKTGMWKVTENDDTHGQIVTDSGNTWFCDYCSFRDLCLNDGEGNAPDTATDPGF